MKKLKTVLQKHLTQFCSFGLSANQPTVSFSHTKLAPATSHQPANIIFSYNKSASATAKQTDMLEPLGRGIDY